MKVKYRDSRLARAERDATETAGMSQQLASVFRRRMQSIRAATDIRDIAAIRGNRLEKLKGSRSHQHSIRLNDQYRLIIELQNEGHEQVLLVVTVEDYH